MDSFDVATMIVSDLGLKMINDGSYFAISISDDELQSGEVSFRKLFARSRVRGFVRDSTVVLSNGEERFERFDLCEPESLKEIKRFISNPNPNAALIVMVTLRGHCASVVELILIVLLNTNRVLHVLGNL